MYELFLCSLRFLAADLLGSALQELQDVASDEDDDGTVFTDILIIFLLTPPVPFYHGVIHACTPSSMA